LDVCAAGKGVADDHDIISGVVERTPGSVRDGDAPEESTAFEGDVLVDKRGHLTSESLFTLRGKVK